MDIGRGMPIKSCFVDRRFLDVDGLSTTILEDKLKEKLEGIKKKKRKDSEDVARILVLLSRLTLFFHNGDNNQMDIHSTC